MVAYTVGISIEQTVAIAVIARFGMVTRAVIVCRVRIVIARRTIHAARHFEFIAHAVAVCVIHAGAVAIVA